MTGARAGGAALGGEEGRPQCLNIQWASRSAARAAVAAGPCATCRRCTFGHGCWPLVMAARAATSPAAASSRQLHTPSASAGQSAARSSDATPGQAQLAAASDAFLASCSSAHWSNGSSRRASQAAEASTEQAGAGKKALLPAGGQRQARWEPPSPAGQMLGAVQGRAAPVRLRPCPPAQLPRHQQRLLIQPPAQPAGPPCWRCCSSAKGGLRPFRRTGVITGREITALKRVFINYE